MGKFQEPVAVPSWFPREFLAPTICLVFIIYGVQNAVLCRSGGTLAYNSNFFSSVPIIHKVAPSHGLHMNGI